MRARPKCGVCCLEESTSLLRFLLKRTVVERPSERVSLQKAIFALSCVESVHIVRSLLFVLVCCLFILRCGQYRELSHPNIFRILQNISDFIRAELFMNI